MNGQHKTHTLIIILLTINMVEPSMDVHDNIIANITVQRKNMPTTLLDPVDFLLDYTLCAKEILLLATVYTTFSLVPTIVEPLHTSNRGRVSLGRRHAVMETLWKLSLTQIFDSTYSVPLILRLNLSLRGDPNLNV